MHTMYDEWQILGNFLPTHASLTSARGAGLRYHEPVIIRAYCEEPQGLKEMLPLLGELGRLELDLLVRDLPTQQAVGILIALGEELDEILERTSDIRRRARSRFDALERSLSLLRPGAEAAEHLGRLAEGRRSLGDLDMALRPVQVLKEEVVRRSNRRPPPE